jgi:hypothetical protein
MISAGKSQTTTQTESQRKKTMAKRKGRRSNPLQINVHKVALPPGVTASEYFAGLKKAVKTKTLPDGWEVDIEWRNPATKQGATRNWQSGEWGDVLRNSRAGFATVLNRIIKAAAGDTSPEPAKKKTKPAKKKKLPKSELKKRRSAASKKGWETRRRNAKGKQGDLFE